MKSKLFQMEYYDTYHFALMLDGILKPSFEYPEFVDQFFDGLEHGQFLAGFQRFSALHQFIEFEIETVTLQSVDDVVEDALVNVEGYELWINEALRYFKIEHTAFEEWLDEKGIELENISETLIREYHDHLYDTGPFQALLARLTEEIFFLLFMNRDFLRRFNESVASYVMQFKIKNLSKDEKLLFTKDGVLKRGRIPVWARRAVFFRDRGLCGYCHRDISGLVSIHSDKHYDHIVPLAKGGINDVTNLQLLCEKCNLRKKHRNTNTSKYYERWYR